jgi:translation initiation factor IF-2
VPRIYSLAKELGFDSKELVDVCTKAGVTGKGSALASLSDDEVEKLKAYLKGGAKSTVKTAETKVVEPSVEDVRVKRGFTRDDYIGPGGASTDKLETTDSDTTSSETEVKKSDVVKPAVKPAVKKGPVIKLAAMPSVKKPSVPASQEPAPQKPDLRLPPDAILGAKEGSRAPLEQFTKPDNRRSKGTAASTPKKPTEYISGQSEGPLATRKRGKVDKPAGGKDQSTGKRGLAGMAGSRVARQQSRKTRKPDGSSASGEYNSTPRLRRGSRPKRHSTNTAAPRKDKITLVLPCTVRSFSETSGISTRDIQGALLGMGTMATINMQLDAETAELLAAELGVEEVEFKRETSLEDVLLRDFESYADDPADVVPRPPIITFLGHVDHGKTSLLDSIIGTSVADGEAGGITQHIRAYTIEKEGRQISFVDTPGHAAFTEMRARGANVTDIAVLVVAADDGVMPQTEEATSHARAAGVPIVVALNKIDLPGVDENRALQTLAAKELLPAEWGGDIEVVRTSATTGEGVDNLLETLLLTADLHEYKANPQRPGQGVCLEAQQEAGRGVVAKLMVKTGTLRVGDIVVCGASYGRVKAMYDTLHPRQKLKAAPPSTPINITGLNQAPEAGEAFYVLDDIVRARDIADQREVRAREQALAGQIAHISFEDFQTRLQEGRLGYLGETVNLNLILRADVQGSIEAIQKELDKLDHPEVKVKLLQTSVGGITFADVTLAHASQAVIVGFNVIPDEAARALADERGVEIRRYDVIYKVTDDIKLLLEGKLKPEERVLELGRVLVKQVFSVSRMGKIAGCHIVKGIIERGCRIRVNRDGRGIGDYALDSLRREKDDVKEVREGYECGIRLSGFNDVKEGDVFEAYKIEEVARTLESV